MSIQKIGSEDSVISNKYTMVTDGFFRLFIELCREKGVCFLSLMKMNIYMLSYRWKKKYGNEAKTGKVKAKM